ncbi:MAG: SLC13 family permease [Luteolibacter sp.]
MGLVLTLVLPPPPGLDVLGWHSAGVAILMAVFWITEPVPIPATALLPLVLFPALGLADGVEAAAPFSSPIIYLFLGGFFIAAAMQKWGLHRRLALGLLARVGTRPSRLVAGFLLSAALLSMWVSNTATAMMMMPIALSVTQMARCSAGSRSQVLTQVLLLAVAYGATAGGMATLIGTPPNAMLAGYMESVHGVTIGFGQWMMLGVPLTLLSLPLIYFVLTRVSFRLGDERVEGIDEILRDERVRLGSMSRGELVTALVFAFTAMAWVLRPLLAGGMPGLSDTSIAIAGALLLFMIPLSASRGEFALDWEAAKGVPWGVLLLFGGGMSLAAVIEKHGLASYLGELFSHLEGIHLALVLGVVCFVILMLTELTSNTATAATFLPIMGAMALSLGQNPLLFLIPCALAANCSFMMPVGTPPNAIVFGSGQLSLPQMAHAGIWLNLLMVPAMLAMMLLLGKWVFGIEFGIIPDWALD